MPLRVSILGKAYFPVRDLVVGQEKIPKAKKKEMCQSVNFRALEGTLDIQCPLRLARGIQRSQKGSFLSQASTFLQRTLMLLAVHAALPRLSKKNHGSEGFHCLENLASQGIPVCIIQLNQNTSNQLNCL